MMATPIIIMIMISCLTSYYKVVINVVDTVLIMITEMVSCLGI